MIELHHYEPGPGSGEVLILLKEKGIDFVGRYVDLAALEQFEPAFLQLNPRGQVPVLVHDGRALAETGFILQYLDQVFPTPTLTPPDARGRYWVNVWIKYVEEYLGPAAWRLGARRHPPKISAAAAEPALARAPAERRAAWTRLLEGGSEDEQEAARALLPVRLGRMEEALASGPFLAGGHYSLADIAVFPTLAALAPLAPDLIAPERTPRIIEWLERIRARPPVQAALAMARSPDPFAACVCIPGPEGSRWG